MTDRRRRIFAVGLYALMPVAAVVFYGQAAIEPVTFTERGKCPGTECAQILTMVEPTVLLTLQVSAGSLALVLLIAGALALHRRDRWRGALALVLALAAYPVSCLVMFNPTRWGSWGYSMESGKPKGKHSVFVVFHFQSSILYLSGPWKHGTWTRSTKVLAIGERHTGEYAVPIVRPAGRKRTTYLQLIRCADTLLGIAESRVSVAYDTKRKRAYGWEKLYSLSPFICLKKGDVLDSADKKALIDWVEWECKHGDTLQQIPALLATMTREMEHPNAEARALARDFTKCLRARLAKSQVEEMSVPTGAGQEP